MSTLTSIPVSDPKRFLTLQDSYKQELMGDLRLEEASALAARRQMLLENGQVDPNWALPQVKAMSRKLHRLTKRIRQPFGSTPSSSEMFPQDTDDPAEDFAAGPVQALVKRLIQPTPSPIKTPPNKAPVKRKSGSTHSSSHPIHSQSQEKSQARFQRRQGPHPGPSQETRSVPSGIGNTHSLQPCHPFYECYALTPRQSSFLAPIQSQDHRQKGC